MGATQLHAFVPLIHSTKICKPHLSLKSIESLGNGQKVLAKKVIEFSDAFKNTIEKIINEESNKRKAFETKMNGLQVLNNHSDEIKTSTKN